MENNKFPKKITKSELFPGKFGKSAFLLKSNFDLFPKDGYIVFELSPKPVVVIFAVTQDKKVIMVKQYRHAANQYSVEVPGGLSEINESLAQTAWRELQEETGFVAKKMIQLTDQPVWFDPASVTTPFRPFLALGCYDSDIKKPISSEGHQILFFPLAKWIKNIQDGKILDAKTIVTTFLALKHLNRK